MNSLESLMNIDPQKETERIIEKLRADLSKTLRKRGAVVGISGGIDSSVVLALCAKAFGPKKVLGIMLPEKESSKDNYVLARELTKTFDVDYVIEDITGALEGFGVYRRRDAAIKRVFPEYDQSYKAKIILPNNILDKNTLNVFQIMIISPEGVEQTKRLPVNEYLEIVAASNFKQRSRMSMLYFYADAKNYAVIGTGNKNEHEQGFFVKYGDGGADVKPIAHLFKTQVYQLAEYLGVPAEIRRRTPTTDTYSAEQTQEEFFFRIPYKTLDKIWLGWEQGYSNEDIAKELELEPDQIENVIQDIIRKKSATEYLRMEPL
ncbi:NAD synthetase [hydrothermal vent metagenome]|uniref:NAD synthetase n=1 Tax=hydrothermal vent metagenome TaxID=652676 RepID=A0A3B1C8E3_9ZZZZ